MKALVMAVKSSPMIEPAKASNPVNVMSPAKEYDLAEITSQQPSRELFHTMNPAKAVPALCASQILRKRDHLNSARTKNPSAIRIKRSSTKPASPEVTSPSSRHLSQHGWQSLSNQTSRDDSPMSSAHGFRHDLLIPRRSYSPVQSYRLLVFMAALPVI